MDFRYPAENGKTEATVRFHDGCAFWVKPGFVMDFQPKPVPSKGAYPGQPVREMVTRMGQPESMVEGQITLTLVYASGVKVIVAHGFVLHIYDQ